MTGCVVVVEDVTAKHALERLLKQCPVSREVRIVAAGGWSSADSLARSFLMAGTDDVVLAVNAGGAGPAVEQSRRSFLAHSLGSVASPGRWSVVLFTPHLDGMLLAVPGILERLLGRKPSEVDLLRARLEPDALLADLGVSTRMLNAFITDLPDEFIGQAADLQPIKELFNFLRGARRRSESSRRTLAVR